jgi:hypothetical protein
MEGDILQRKSIIQEEREEEVELWKEEQKERSMQKGEMILDVPHLGLQHLEVQVGKDPGRKDSLK